MADQNYKNHTRYWYPHHFIFYPIILGCIIISLRRAAKDPALSEVWIAIAVILFLIGWVAFMMRQHYGLMNQDRIVRLELRLRYFQLTQQRLEPLESKMTFSQLSALRFASDNELVALIGRTLKEGLKADAIKRSIIEWLPDHMRV